MAVALPGPGRSYNELTPNGTPGPAAAPWYRKMSAPLPPVGPDDHVRGPDGARLAIVYGDYECPFCAALEVRLRALHSTPVSLSAPTKTAEAEA